MTQKQDETNSLRKVEVERYYVDEAVTWRFMREARLEVPSIYEAAHLRLSAIKGLQVEQGPISDVM